MLKKLLKYAPKLYHYQQYERIIFEGIILNRLIFINFPYYSMLIFYTKK